MAKTKTKAPSLKDDELKSLLSKMGHIYKMNDGSPYIHNYEKYFEEGYESIKGLVESSILKHYNNKKGEINSIAKTARGHTTKILKQLGFKNEEELNQLYTEFLLNNEENNFARYAKEIQEYKHSTIDARLNPKDNNIIADRQELSKTLNQELSKLYDKNKKNVSLPNIKKYLIDKNELNDAVNKGTYFESVLGFIFEDVSTKAFEEFLKKYVSDITTKTKQLGGDKKTKNINTRDSRVRVIKDGEAFNIIFTIKNSAGTADGQYSDFFKVGRGSAGSTDDTFYNLENLLKLGSYDPDEIEAINYVVYNHKAIRGTSFTGEIIDKLKYVAGWEFIINGLYGNAFSTKGIKKFPAFLLTQDRVISTATIVETLSKLQFISMQNLLSTSQSVFNFEKLSTGLKKEVLLKDKREIIANSIDNNNNVNRAEFVTQLGSKESLKRIQNKIKSNLGFKVKYQIALANIEKLL